MSEPEKSEIGLAFSFFTEIGIISQLSSAGLAKILPDGVHPSHFAILNHLTLRGDGRTPLVIAKAMQVTKATMTHSISVLEKRGFVRTEANPDDARSKIVTLTDEGRHFRETAIAELGSRFSKIIGAQELKQIEIALPALRHMRQLLDDNR